MQRRKSQRLGNHKVKNDQKRKKSRDTERKPPAEVTPIRRGQRLPAARRTACNVAHPDLQPHDRQPAGTGNQVQDDRPEYPARGQRKRKAIHEIKARDRLHHHRGRGEKPVGDYNLARDEERDSSIAAEAGHQHVKRGSDAGAEQQRR